MPGCIGRGWNRYSKGTEALPAFSSRPRRRRTRLFLFAQRDADVAERPQCFRVPAGDSLEHVAAALASVVPGPLDQGNRIRRRLLVHDLLDRGEVDPIVGVLQTCAENLQLGPTAENRVRNGCGQVLGQLNLAGARGGASQTP